jgi:hypothetical protein
MQEQLTSHVNFLPAIPVLVPGHATLNLQLHMAVLSAAFNWVLVLATQLCPHHQLWCLSTGDTKGVFDDISCDPQTHLTLAECCHSQGSQQEGGRTE